MEYGLPLLIVVSERTNKRHHHLREGSSQEEMGKWLKIKSIPWPRLRRLLLVVTGTFPCGQQMLKYGYRSRVVQLWQIN
jgi:hypothetical protein